MRGFPLRLTVSPCTSDDTNWPCCRSKCFSRSLTQALQLEIFEPGGQAALTRHLLLQETCYCYPGYFWNPSVSLCISCSINGTANPTASNADSASYMSTWSEACTSSPSQSVQSSSSSSSSGSGGSCFPSSATVQTQEGLKQMQDLAVGEKVGIFTRLQACSASHSKQMAKCTILLLRLALTCPGPSSA